MNPYGSKFYYNKLSTNDKEIYNSLIDCIRQLKKTTKLKPSVSINKNNISKILQYIYYDNPDIFYLDTNKCYLESTLFNKIIHIEYIYDINKVKELYKNLTNKANQIINSQTNKHQTEYEIVFNLHEFLRSTIKYDKEALDLIIKGNKNNCNESHSVIGALLKNKCVCEGYAKAMHMLCSMIGVESIYVVGDSTTRGVNEPHAWNIVKINGYYHHIDVTWDSQYENDEAIPSYAYLNISDQSIAKNHTWDRNIYPKCNEEPYNYFKINSALIGNIVQLERYIYENMSDEEEFIIFKFNEKFVHNNITQCIYECINKAMNKCKYNGLINYTIHQEEQQQTYTLKMNYN